MYLRKAKMEFFKKKCPYCGKENPVTHVDAEAFCNKMCEANYKYERRFGRKV